MTIVTPTWTDAQVPTYDADASVGHPGVVDVGSVWNGYRYWMVHSPYPGNSRENPSVVASNDGATWVTPDGLTNPVSPQSEATADGFAAHSDPDIVYDSANDRLAIIYRAQDGGTPAEALYLKTSTDGVTWSARDQLFTTNNAGELLSPSVVKEADGTWSMWCVDSTATPNKLTKRTAATLDGTWSAPSDCTISAPSGVNPWHFDVIRDGTDYYALLNTETNWELFYLTSTDAGLTWTGRNAQAVPQSGASWDRSGHYRPAWLASDPGNHLFYVWVTGLDATQGSAGGNIFHADAEWRISTPLLIRLDWNPNAVVDAVA